MKQMSFSNSCCFACIAHLLEDFDIYVKDIDIIYDLNLIYLFHKVKDKDKDKYISGCSIQESFILNKFLNKFNLEFEEILISKEASHVTRLKKAKFPL